MTARTPSFPCSLAVGILVLFISGGMPARAADRLALVIGNAHYASAPSCRTPRMMPKIWPPPSVRWASM